MKKIYLFLFLSVLIFSFSNSFTQESSKGGMSVQSDDRSFHKRSKVIDIGLDFGIYSTVAVNDIGDAPKSGMAASGVYPFGFEYGIGNKFGIGAILSFSHYISKKDSATGNKPSAGSSDFSVKGSFHFVRSARTDIFFGMSIGLSSFKYLANDKNNTEFKSGGGNFGINLTGRFYVSKHIGIIANLAYAYYGYPNGKITDDIGNNYTMGFFLDGVNIGTGMAIKW